MLKRKAVLSDANDKNLLNDKDKLMAYWKRFSAKNRLTPYVIKQVQEELNKQFIDIYDFFLNTFYLKLI